MKVLILATAMLFLSSATSARSTYYPTKFKNFFEQGTLRDNALKSVIFQLLTKNHVYRSGKDDILVDNCGEVKGRCYQQTSLGYKGARIVLFGKLHLQEDSSGYFVKDVYCEKDISKFDTQIGPRTIPNDKVMNCEHTWPQSRFNRRFSKGLQKSDLHHLFPTDSQANSKRGNHPFGEVGGKAVAQNCSSSFIGKDSNRRIYFEPPTAHKGNVARAMFYFSSRYKSKIDPKMEAFLKKWHREDPVDEAEMIRNNLISKMQGNRNPFIDYPELVSLINDF